MESKTSFSIVIPLYNKEEYICKSIDSVLEQNYDEFEIVVVDDGSKDKSYQLVASRYESNRRVRLIQQKNAGPAAARNTGVNYSRMEWILFLDADDILLPNALHQFAKLIMKNPSISYFICNYYIQCNGALSLFQYLPIEGLLKHPFFWEFAGWMSDRPGSAIYKKNLVQKYPFNEKLRRYEDAECQYEIFNIVEVYQSKVPVMISNRDASEAASYRKDIDEDFLGHLNFKGKSFWERMMLYKLARQAVDGYGEVARNMYSSELTNTTYIFIFYFFRIIWLLENVFKKLFAHKIK